MKTIAVLCVVAVGSVAWGADTKAPTKGVLDGIWTLSSGTMAGEKMDEEMSKNIKLTLAGGKYTVNIGEQKDEGTYKTDDSKTPHTLTIVSTDGPEQGEDHPRDLRAQQRIAEGLLRHERQSVPEEIRIRGEHSVVSRHVRTAKEHEAPFQIQYRRRQVIALVDSMRSRDSR